MEKINVKQIIIYIIGMVILATGLSLSTRLDLGTSALTAFPLAFSKIYDVNFGDVTLIYYIIFIVLQIVLHILMKKYKLIISDVLQIFISYIFTRLLNIFNGFIPEFANLNNIFSTVYIRILFMLVSIVLIGIVASLVLKTVLPPNPPDGFVKTTSDYFKINMGTIKNIVDISLVVITIVFSLVVSNKIIGVGIGTVLAMLGVGRVIYFFNKMFGKKIDSFCNS